MEILPVKAKLNVDVKADLTPAVQATADMISTSHKGVGKLLNAFVGPWIANRERAIALLQAQTQYDCQQIAEGELIYQEGRLLSVPDQRPLPNVYETIHGLNHQADAKRLEAAIREAARQISEVPSDQISDDPIPQIFFNHWRREAEMIDEDELRQWWARILVEEAKKPHSISPRTLDVARRLSKEEALLFVKMVKGEVDGIIPVDSKGHPQYISYAEALMLQSAELIFAQRSKRTFGLTYDIDENHNKGTCIPLHSAGLMLCVHKKNFSTDCYILTDAGRRLLSIALEPRRVEDYIAIASRLSSLSGNTIMSLHPIMQRQGAQFTWSNIPVWTSKRVADGKKEDDKASRP